MQNRPAPAYQEYAATILSDRTFRFLSLAQRGLYYTLKLECWVNGSIPLENRQIATIAGSSLDEIEKLLPSVLKWFKRTNDGYVCPELEGYRAHLDKISESRKKAGSIGGKTPRSKEKDAKQMLGKCLPNAEQVSSKLSIVKSSSVKSNPALSSEVLSQHSDWLQGYDDEELA